MDVKAGDVHVEGGAEVKRIELDDVHYNFDSEEMTKVDVGEPGL